MRRSASVSPPRGGGAVDTGLSGAGKPTLASAVERRLHALQCRTFVLGGGNLRHGLCSDLGTSGPATFR